MKQILFDCTCTSSMISKLSFSFHLATDNSLEQLSDEVVYIRCRVMYGLILTWPDMKWRHATRALLACMLYVRCNESFCVFLENTQFFVAVLMSIFILIMHWCDNTMYCSAQQTHFWLVTEWKLKITKNC